MMLWAKFTCLTRAHEAYDLYKFLNFLIVHVFHMNIWICNHRSVVETEV